MKKTILLIITAFFSLNIIAAQETPAATPKLPEPALLKTTPTQIQTTAPTQATSVPMPAAPTIPMPTAPKLAPTPTLTGSLPQLNRPLPKLPKIGPSRSSPPIIPAPPVIDAKGYLLIDADSGYIITQQNQDVPMAPASLTKLMTMYIVSGALKEGRIKLTDNVPVSEAAWRTGGSRMFIQVGTQVPVQDLINGIVIASGNDACIAMSEFIAGSQSSFVDLMNKMSAQLGMKNTHYADPTGLPDPTNYTTPYDLSILTRAIIYHYPQDYKWYSQKEMTYNNIKQSNRNLLLYRDPTVDGLKTGHTDDAGYCLVASAKRDNNMRLIAIVMGSKSPKQRANDVEALLNYGFRFFETHQIYTANTPLSKQRIWFGKNKETAFGVGQNFYVTTPIGQYQQLKAALTMEPKLQAPIVKGQSYGQAQVTLNNQVIATQPLIALADNPVGGFFSRMIDHVSSWFSKIMS